MEKIVAESTISKLFPVSVWGFAAYVIINWIYLDLGLIEEKQAIWRFLFICTYI